MNDDMKEQLSGLMDGEFEAHADEAIGQLINSRPLRETWWRYHLISDVLKQNLPDLIDRQLVAKVADSISDEPVVPAPFRIVKNQFFKPLAGLAIAASVTAIAIVGIQNKNEPQQNLPAARVADTAPTYNTNISQQYTFPVSATMVTRQPGEPAENVNPNSRLNSYLVNYNEFRASQNGVHGIIPYVRIIANENDQ
jgi:sigma-E factor negative regulatory protein RseA